MVGLALLSGCASLNNKPELSDIRPLPRFFLQELITGRKISGLEIAVYDTGRAVVSGEVLSELKSPDARVQIPVPTFLIRHPGQGLILFDAGLLEGVTSLSEENAVNTSEFSTFFISKAEQDMIAQLARDGVDPKQIKWVVLSHLHQDNVGKISSFQNATVIVDRREWEAQKQKTSAGAVPGEFDPVAMESSLRLRLVDMSSAGPYGVFDHGIDLFQDGALILLDMAGHTPGSMGLWVNMDSGPVFLTGDASWVLDNHQDMALPLRRTMADPAQYWRKLNMINRMQQSVPALVVFPGHDLMPLKLQPRPDISMRAASIK